jgi:hypothetical protein
MISRTAGAMFSVLVTQQLLRLVPGLPSLGGDDLGDSGAVSAFHLHNCSSDLSLVLPGGDDGADVDDLSIFSN